MASTISWSPAGSGPVTPGPCGKARVGVLEPGGIQGLLSGVVGVLAQMPEKQRGMVVSISTNILCAGTVCSLPPPPSLEQAGDSPGTQGCMGHRRGLAVGKGGHRSGLSVLRSPWRQQCWPRGAALTVGPGREAPTALFLPGLGAGLWAVTQQRREGPCPVLAPAQRHLRPFLQGQSPDRCQVLTLIHTRE